MNQRIFQFSIGAFFVVATLAVFFPSQSRNTNSIVPPSAPDVTDEMSIGEPAKNGNRTMQSDADTTIANFRKETKKYATNLPLSLLSTYYDQIGPEAMLDVIEEDSACHSKGHNIGKIIYQKTQHLPTAMNICRQRCTTGCFHGVLMQLFGKSEASDHVGFDDIKDKMNSLCQTKEIGKFIGLGGCIHGMGHVLMNIADYDIPLALGYCDAFKDRVSNYYCTTGAYMERNQVFSQEDKRTALLYPCNEYQHPAACFRYKLDTLKKDYTFAQIAQHCLSLANEFIRAGCFHGLGFAFSNVVRAGKLPLSTLCSSKSDRDRQLCIEGAIGLMREYSKPTAQQVCTTLSDTDRPACFHAIEVGNFGMNRDVSYYFYKP